MTTVAYAPTTNPNVVGQRPAFGKHDPQIQWVVQSLSTTDSLANNGAGTTTASSYFYWQPEYRVDPFLYGYAFRGFDQVTTNMSTGATRLDVYDYGVDFSGRHVSTQISPATNEQTVQFEVRSVEDTTWKPFVMYFPGPSGLVNSGTPSITTYHAVAVDKWACKNGQAVDACRSSVNDDTHVRTLASITPLATQYGLWLWKETGAILQTGANAGASYDYLNPQAVTGDRVTASAYLFVADAAAYRLLPQQVTKSVQGDANPFYAKVKHTFDSTNTVALTDEVWVDFVDAHRSITTRTYDMQTGNVLTRRKPAQDPGAWQSQHSGAVTSYTYDARKLFVTTETSEPDLGGTSLVRNFNYEYGTGTKLETTGPNFLPCHYYVQGCPTGVVGAEDHRIRVDGLGRTIERHETFMNYGGTTYMDVVVEQDSYVDAPAAYFTQQTAIDGALDYAGEPVRYAQSKTELDGHGRPMRKTVYAQGAATTDAITTYQFNDVGTLRSVTVPDPTANDSSTVVYTYTFDSLGRPTAMNRPDDASPGNQSGVSISYNGLTTTTTELVGAASGNPATTTTIKDAFGRLRYVYEQIASGPTWSITTYDYGPDDNTTVVTDAEGKLTTMTHDFAGHRTSITRNARTWSYAYDGNGNMVSVTVPGATDQFDAPNYLTSITYDDLDRPTSKLIGSRGMSPADVAYFGTHHETFTYDNAAAGGNDSGRLYEWASYSSPTTPMLYYFPQFDAQGRRQEDYRAINGVAGSSFMQRMTYRNYRLDGSPGGTWYYDTVGASPTQSTYTEVRSDARALPYYLYVATSTQQPWWLVLDTRNVAGLVTKQAPTGSYGAASTAIESDWTYDKLGRVTSQKVLQNGGTTTVARQDLAYFGNDDPRQLDQYLGTNHKTFQYTFDYRHQITGASETTTAGYFNATYQYGTAGRLAAVDVASTLPPHSSLASRNVTYQYATGINSDPEEVIGLANVDSSAYARFTYDAVGNQTMRCAGGTIVSGACTPPPGGTATETDYVYDGKDQLRRATKKVNGVTQGSEEYWYDGDGHRMIAVKRDGSNAMIEMIWWIGEVEAHYDTTFTVTHVLSYLSLGGAVARVDRTADTVTSVENIYHGLGGSTLAAVDQVTGTVNASFSYSPFGEVIEAVDAGGSEGLASQTRRWNDKFVDAVHNLAYYGARYYDITTLTWTQGDPLYRFVPDLKKAGPRRAGLYTYSLNNPLRYLDPDGLDSTCPNGSCKHAVDHAEHKDRPDVAALRDDGGVSAAQTAAMNPIVVWFESGGAEELEELEGEIIAGVEEFAGEVEAVGSEFLSMFTENEPGVQWCSSLCYNISQLTEYASKWEDVGQAAADREALEEHAGAAILRVCPRGIHPCAGSSLDSESWTEGCVYGRTP